MKKLLSSMILCAFTFVQTGFAATVGDLTPGSASNAGVTMNLTGQFTGTNNSPSLNASTYDPTTGYLYYGSLFGQGLTRVKKDNISGAIFLPTPGISNYTQAEIDTTHGYAYFLSQSSPTNLIKVQLSDFTIAGTLTLSGASANGASLVVDATDQIALIGTNTFMDSRIQKIDLTTMTMTQEVTPAEFNFTDAAYDATTKTAYFVTNVNVSSKIVRVDLTDITNRSTLALSIGGVRSLGEIANGYLIGTQVIGSPSNQLIRINMGTFTEAGTLDLGAGSTQTTMINTDVATGQTYVATNNSSGNTLFRVDNSTLSVLNSFAHTRGSSSVEIDDTDNEFYVGNGNDITRFDRTTFTPTLTRTIRVNENNIYDLTVTNNGTVFGLTQSQFNYPELIKINPATMEKSDIVFLNNDDYVRKGNNITYNPISDKFYVGVRTATNEAKLFEYDPATVNKTRELTLSTGSNVGKGYISQDGLTGYFPVTTNVSSVEKVDLTTFTSLGSVSTATGAGDGVLAVDESNSIGYIIGRDINLTGDPAILKFNLNTMTYLDQLILPETASENSLALDTAGKRLYVGTTSSPAKILSINTDTFALSTSLTLTADDSSVNHIIVVPQKGIGFVSTAHTSGAAVTAFTLGTMISTANHINTEGYGPSALTYDSTNSLLYFSTDKDPARIEKIQVTSPAFLYATKVTLTDPSSVIHKINMYSHAAGGNVMLAVYDSAKNLIWESASTANTVSNGVLSIPISAGTPTNLTLTPGDYYIAFQLNNADGVASIKTVSNAGIKLSNTYGTFPSSISAGTTTNDSFSIGATFNSAVVASSVSHTITEGAAASTFTLALSDAPTNDVTINLATVDGVIASPTSLTFTALNWNTPQTVSLSIPNDNVAGANRSSSVTFTLTSVDPVYNNLTVAAHTVSIIDAGAPAVPPIPGFVGGSGGGGSSSSSNTTTPPATNTGTTPTNPNNNGTTPTVPTTPTAPSTDLTPPTSTVVNPTTNTSVNLTQTTYYPTTPSGQPVITYSDAQKISSVTSLKVPEYIPYEASLCPTLSRQVYLSEIKDINSPILAEYAMNLVKKGVAFDVKNNEIDPNQKVARSDVLKYSLQTSCDQYAQYIIDQKPFSDVSITHRNALYISLAKLRNIVSGYENDYKFRADQNITRAEALKIVIEATLGDGKRTFDGTSEPFTDIPWKDDTVWFRHYVRFAYEKGIITLPENKEYRPYDEVNKSEIIYMLTRALAVRDLQ